MPRTALATPVDLLAIHARQPGRYPFLLQTLGRPGWDILFAWPQRRDWLSGPDPVDQIDAATGFGPARPNKPPLENGADLPFRGGWFVYLAYELLHAFEPTVRPPTTADQRYACLVRIPAAVLRAHGDDRTWLFAEAGFEDLLPAMRADCETAPFYTPDPPLVRELREDPPETYLANLARIQRYIREGDVFQVNYSRGWRARVTTGTAATLYARLRATNPAPFAALADFGDFQIISSSPERLVRIRGLEVDTCPIAGTFPRAADPAEDARRRAALAAHPKERAEHVMLVDLERNDLGRICEPGSVRVGDFMAVRSYAAVHHIESEVRGRLQASVTPGRVIRALFPGGTITGCPKVRTAQIIADLEGVPRGAYTGSLGYLNRDGDMDLNILIRTLVLRGKRLSFRTGAGIVADSVPERELDETRAKARALLRALA